jgi:hypothetical protein
MAKSKECKYNQNVFPVKVQHSHSCKFDNFRPAWVRFLKNNILSLKHKIENTKCPRPSIIFFDRSDI